MTGSVSLQQGLIQIRPCRVEGLDQRNFAFSGTGFELLFSGNGGLHGRVLLKPHQRMNLVLLAKAIKDIVIVLPHPLDQIAGHADVKRAVGSVGEQINAGLFHDARNLKDCVARVTWYVAVQGHGLPRPFGPRNDGSGVASP